ncbi:MAG: SufE family protein [Hyphomicrobiales bacterium]|jgi:cysteine desulfuration protein SufE|nr:SufE family protein [Hyphomicrobiales bacterium]NBR11593.1 SufE family protein [Alphaproteobacteria bacterium]
MASRINEIIENFGFLEDWEDRYRYLIELGKDLPDLPESERTEDNRVKGCASQVWVVTAIDRSGLEPVLSFKGQSDAHIVKGLVALTLALYSDKTAREILSIDALDLFRRLGLAEHLTPQRSNGVRSMVERIRRDALAASA